MRIAPASGLALGPMAAPSSAEEIDLDRPDEHLQRTADLQIWAEDATRLTDALQQATFYEVPGMTHVFKIAPGETRADTLATDADPALPLAPGLADRIAGFILGSR